MPLYLYRHGLEGKSQEEQVPSIRSWPNKHLVHHHPPHKHPPSPHHPHPSPWGLDQDRLAGRHPDRLHSSHYWSLLQVERPPFKMQNWFLSNFSPGFSSELLSTFASGLAPRLASIESFLAKSSGQWWSSQWSWRQSYDVIFPFCFFQSWFHSDFCLNQVCWEILDMGWLPCLGDTRPAQVMMMGGGANVPKILALP